MASNYRKSQNGIKWNLQHLLWCKWLCGWEIHVNNNAFNVDCFQYRLWPARYTEITHSVAVTVKKRARSMEILYLLQISDWVEQHELAANDNNNTTIFTTITTTTSAPNIKTTRNHTTNSNNKLVDKNQPHFSYGSNARTNKIQLEIGQESWNGNPLRRNVCSVATKNDTDINR